MANYKAEDIEVLSGLDPVKRRPGMYTDTTRPNHLAQEVVDNSVDEALIGCATEIQVNLYKDGSLEVEDNGRGMPVDIHPEEKVSGVELIMTRLHAGGKFSDKNYQFSGGLHGVGISVVNALSDRVDVEVKRDANVYEMSFLQGDKSSELGVVGAVGKRDTGTKIRFWPNEKYFETVKFSVSKLKHVLKAKAVLCSGLRVSFYDENTGEDDSWCYEKGLNDYLLGHVVDCERVPFEPFSGSVENHQSVEWSTLWLTAGDDGLTESYVNLIPTIQGGSHVQGFRTGLLEAMREFCEFRDLLPRGVKLSPEDVWEHCSYILSVKLHDPQFSGQTKERLTSRECAVVERA